MSERQSLKAGLAGVLALACVAGAGTAPALAADRPARTVEAAAHGPARMRLVEGIPFLTLAGTYREMGEQYGALLKDRIELGPAASSPLAPAERERLERSLGSRLGPFLRGVAAGSGTGLDGLLRAVFSLPPHGCSSILARTRADGERSTLLHAKNLDLPGAPALGAHAVVELRPRGELRVLFTGLFGMSDGMNERGITVSVDLGSGCPLAAPARPPTPGAPELLGRAFDFLATARSLADVDRVVAAAPIDAAMILVVGSAAEGDGVVYDLACGTVRRTAMRGADQLFVTNKYLHPDLTPPEQLRACPRYRILDERLRGGARLAGPDALLDVLADAGQGYGVNNRDTRQSAIYDGEARVLRLAVRDGYAAWGQWLEYDWRRDRATVGPRGGLELGETARWTRPAGRAAAVRELLPDPARQDALWAELREAVAARSAVRTAAGYAVYHGRVGEHTDVEIVQPVDRLAPDAGRVTFRATEAIQVLTVRHHGPHDTLRAAEWALAGWMEEHGLAAAGPARHAYLHGSWDEADPRRWETEVEVPVVRRPSAPADRPKEEP